MPHRSNPASPRAHSQDGTAPAASPPSPENPAPVPARSTPSTHGNPRTWLPRLLSRLDEQLDLAAELQDLSRRQHHFAESGDFEHAIAIILQREPIVARMVQVDEDLRPFAESLGELLRLLPESDRTKVATKIQRLTELMAAVNQRDELDRSVLERRRSELAGELATLSRGKGAVASYLPADDSAVFQDRQG